MTANEETCFDVNGGNGCQSRYENETFVKQLKENGISDVDDVVSYRSSKSINSAKGKIVISKCVCIFVVVTVILLVACVGLIARFVGKTSNCNATEVAVSETVNPYETVESPSTEDPSLPWSGIRLPKNIVPYFYNLTLKVDTDNFTFAGSVDINVHVSESTPHVVIHVYKLSIDKNAVDIFSAKNGRVEIFNQQEYKKRQFYVINLKGMLEAGVNYTIRFGQFIGFLRADLRGLYRSSYKDESGNDRIVVSSQLQAVDARKVFPCFDEPALKATFAVSLIYKQGFIALSNMPVRKTSFLPNNWVRRDFMTTPIMSTYLLGFVVSDYTYRETTLAKSDLQIRIWAPKQQFHQTDYALEVASKAYPYFEDFFGIPELVPKADHVAIPDFSGGAMENWGIVLYRESALLFDEEKSSIFNKHNIAIVMCHEIAHTWFGNLVTMTWWDDLWLNEAFASILMYFATDHIFPNWGSFDLLLVDDVLQVFIRDALLESHPISTPIKDPGDIPQLFDEISYYKGMAVLRQLQGFIGDDVFRDALKNYVTLFKFNNTVQSQLWQQFTIAARNLYDIEEVMGSWTLQMGYPVVMVKSLGDGKFNLEQNRFLLNPNEISNPAESPYEYRWHIPFTFTTSNGYHTTVWLHRASAQISVGDVTWLVGNLNKTGFYVVNYESDMWTAIIEQLKNDHTVFDKSTRVGLVNDAFLLARAGHIDYTVPLNLTTYLINEKDYVPWKALHNSLDFLEDMLSITNLYGHYEAYLKIIVSKLYRTMGHSTTGTLPERLLKKLILKYACQTGVPDAVSYAKTMFESWMKYDNVVPPDYALIIYSMGIREGGVAEWDFLWNKYSESNIATEKETMMEALAQSKEPWLLRRYIRRTFEPNLIRFQDAPLVFKYLVKNPLGRYIALQFMKEHWAFINSHFGQDMFTVREIIFQISSRLTSEYDLNELKALYKREPPSGGAERDAKNGLALIRSNIDWIKRNSHTIERWLADYLELDIV